MWGFQFFTIKAVACKEGGSNIPSLPSLHKLKTLWVLNFNFKFNFNPGRYMRALGSNGTILALGDASSIQGVKMPTTGQVGYLYDALMA